MGFPIDPNHLGMFQDPGCDDPAKWTLEQSWTMNNSRLKFTQEGLIDKKTFSYVPIYKDEIYIVSLDVTFESKPGDWAAQISVGGQAGFPFETLGTKIFTIQAAMDSFNPGVLANNFWITCNSIIAPPFAVVHFDNFNINRVPEMITNTYGFQPHRTDDRPARGETIISANKIIYRMAARNDATNVLFKVETD